MFAIYCSSLRAVVMIKIWICVMCNLRGYTMAKNRLTVILVLCTGAVYGAQQEGKMVEKKAPGFAGRTESVLHSTISLAGRLAMRGLGFATNYPRLTCAIVTVAPMVVPRYRYFVGRQAGRIVRIATRKMGRWLQQGLQNWLLKPFDDKIEVAQHGLDEQYQILGGHTGQLTGLQGRMDKVYDDTQGLVARHATLHENVLKMQDTLSRHSEQLDVISELSSKTHDQSRATHATVEAQSAQLASLVEQEGATSAHVQKVAASMEELYAQLVLVDGKMTEEKTEINDKIELLARDLAQLSADQRQLFQDYGTQFSGRFDRMAENLRVILESMPVRQAMTCGQQSRMALRQ